MTTENTHSRIDFFNSLALDQRIGYCDELLSIAQDYIAKKYFDTVTGYKIFDCIQGMRTSRFIESGADLQLLHDALQIVRTLNNPPEILKQTLSAILYYSDVLPDSFNKLELKEELENLKEAKA